LKEYANGNQVFAKKQYKTSKGQSGREKAKRTEK
jgi:hypothetical protein